jgi:hypothetical protein
MILPCSTLQEQLLGRTKIHLTFSIRHYFYQVLAIFFGLVAPAAREAAAGLPGLEEISRLT